MSPDLVKEAIDCLTLYEKCLGHGASLKAISDTLWKRVLDINAGLMVDPVNPHAGPTHAPATHTLTGKE